MEPEIVCDEIVKKDLRPEYCQYHDVGCELSGSCLQCPFTQCVYDNPQGKRRLLSTMRDRKITGLFNSGKSTAELAAMFGVSRRTVQRIVRNAKSQETKNKQAPMSQIPIPRRLPELYIDCFGSSSDGISQ